HTRWPRDWSSDVCSSDLSTATAKAIQVAQTEVSPAAQQAAQSTAAFADTKPPIWEGLGTLHYPVTTASKEAQSFFDQGLRLAYRSEERRVGKECKSGCAR